jgi:hypothetical protein
MKTLSFFRRTARLATAVAVVSAAAYTALIARAWRRYGSPAQGGAGEEDALLDRFMPVYDVVERHRVFVAAPAATVLAAAKDQDLMQSPLTRAIFRTRELVLGATPAKTLPSGLLATVQALGWGVLAEQPEREIVVGAVTKPWEANVTFRALPADRFAAYNEPGDVKIAWTLRARPVGERHSVFMTETRAVATDRTARDRFRRYWAFASPGISAIRWLSLLPLKREAERRYRTPRAA